MSNSTSITLSNLILSRTLCLEDSGWLNSNFFLIDALYLSAFLEYFVLYDELVINIEPEIDNKIVKKQFDQLFNIHMMLIHGDIGFSEAEDLEAPILVEDPVSKDILLSTDMSNSELMSGFLDDNDIIRFKHISYKKRSAEIFNVMRELREEGIDDDPYLAMKLLDIRESFSSGLSYAADYSDTTNIAMKHASRHEEKYRTYQIKKAYDRFSVSLGKDVTELLAQRATLAVYIPPIPAIIFSRATSLREVANEALALREEFHEVKKTFSEYEHTINDDSISLKESLSALHSLKNKMDIFCGNHSDSIVMNVSEWKDLADLTRLLDGVIDKGEFPSLLKLFLGKPAELAGRKIITKNVSYFATVTKEFLEIKNYGNLLQKIFGREITNADFLQLSKQDIAKGFRS